MKFYFSDRYNVPLPANHTFPMQKYFLLRKMLLERKIVSESELIESSPVRADDLVLAHSADYVQSILLGTVSADLMRRIGFPWSEDLVVRALAAAGGTMSAAQSALEDGFSGNLAGGTHHAHRAEGEGYCIFNDFAIAIRHLIQNGKIERAAIVDLDVHQGNGNASILGGRDDIYILSIQGERNFPFRRVDSTVDVDLPDGTSDFLYLETLSKFLPAVIEFKPDIVFYQAGVDPLKEDRLGRLALSLEGLTRRDTMVFEQAKSAGVPVCLAIGGGYALPVELTVTAHANTFAAARSVFG